MNHDVLNTQGGPKRNAQAEVLAADGTAIPHLYSAGELGGINANMYQAGGNLAECLIFGKIAGENAATSKTTSEVSLQAALPKYGRNDIAENDDLASIELGQDQYLGQSNEYWWPSSCSDDFKDGNINNIELCVSMKWRYSLLSDDTITRTIGYKQRMCRSGASSSNRAIKNAVKDALKSNE